MADLFGHKQLRALNWKQPYATLMGHGKIETRIWKTDYRGLVLICASKAEYTENQLIRIAGLEQFNRITEELKTEGRDKMLECRGHAIFIGELIDCRPMEIYDEDACFVEFNPQLYCHIYKDVRRIKPIPWHGSLGWRKLDPEFLKQVEFIDQEYVSLPDAQTV